MPNRVKLATQEVFADANPILAWSMEGDCPWETTDDSDDMISYPDFQAAWNFDGYECPSAHEFSRLIRDVQRPDGGAVEKVASSAAGLCSVAAGVIWPLRSPCEGWTRCAEQQ